MKKHNVNKSYIIYDQDGNIKVILQPQADINELIKSYPGCSYINKPKDLKSIENKKIDVVSKKVINKIPQVEFESLKTQNKNRDRRNVLLSRSDWTELPSNIKRFGPVKCKEWDDYREALRDVNLTNPIWPTKPK